MDTCPIVSPYTNRPTNNPTTCIKSSPIFWCSTCNLKLNTPHIALQHISGNSHKSKVNLNNKDNRRSQDEDQENLVTKRKLQNSVTFVPAPATNPKKAKVQETGNSDILFCSDCNVTLNSAQASKMHFKGKKHATVVTEKMKWPLLSSTSVEHVTSQNEEIVPEQNLMTDKKKKEKPTKGFCYDCNLELNSDEQGIQHYNGTKHKVNAGIISEPPDRWLANQRGRGRGGDEGAFRGDQRNGRGFGSADHGRFGQFHPRPGMFEQGIGGFEQPAHGGGMFVQPQVMVTPNPVFAGYNQVRGRGGLQRKVNWSARGRGLPPGPSSSSNNFNNRESMQEIPVNRGLNRGIQNRGNQNRGNQSKRGQERGRKPAMRGNYNNDNENANSTGPATVPGGKGSLSSYFVSANTTEKHFQQCITNVTDKKDASESKDTVTEGDSTPDSSKSDQEDPLQLSINLESESEQDEGNETCKKATVPGGKGSLSGYFVNASSKDHFKVMADNKKASVLGIKGSLSDYFVGVGTSDHFKPENMTDKSGYKQNGMRGNFSNGSTDYNSSQGYYYSGPQKNEGTQDPEEYFEAMFASSTEKIYNSSTGNYYTTSNYSNVGYMDNSNYEYQRNADATYDSYYAY